MKFKKIPIDYSNIICDKLTRFKPAKIRFKTLYDDIINKFYLEGSLTSLNEQERAEIATEIINSSFKEGKLDNELNKLFLKLENDCFIYDDLSNNYLSNILHFTEIINFSDCSIQNNKNTLWLKEAVNNNVSNLIELRKDKSLLYPLVGVILCEGQTEYTLLNNIFSLYNYNLDKLGLIVIPAGGKNQVARKYYELIEFLKLPIYILLDNDAIQTKLLIDSKLRDCDKLYLIKSGEFEDLIPKNILLKTINYVHNNDYTCNFDDFDDSIPMSHNLDLIYKKYGYGEFKKAQFAKELNEYIKSNCTAFDFNESEIETIVKTLFE